MLRVADKAFDSNVGRQRQGNEDNFFVRPPLFVVADGMGGAQAGEVASQMAVEAFRAGLADEYEAEASLSEVIEDANSRIHELSRSDSQRQGMGTTCTAAYVAEDAVVLAHVGDSRCYLLRNGELTRLTTDHSLVGELVARGKITEDEAELHPQRSVITRALGPEANVRVDTQKIEARDGDVFLLCSDGLTSMIREHQILPLLRDADSLEGAVRDLIGAANDAGGRDNITVIVFRIEEVQARVGTGAAPDGDGYEDFGSGAIRDDEQPTTDTSAAEVAEAVQATDREEAHYRATGTVALQALQPGQLQPMPDPAQGQPAPAQPDQPTAPQEPAAPEEPATRVEPAAVPSAPPPTQRQPMQPLPDGATRKPDAPKRKKKRRIPAGFIVALVLLAIILGGAWIATRAVFFIGADDSSRAVTIYRGLPYDLPLGFELYSRHYTSGKTLDQVPGSRRETFTDHKLRSLDDAEDLVKALEEGRLQP